VCCSVLQRVVVCCSVAGAQLQGAEKGTGELYCVTVCCSVL